MRRRLALREKALIAGVLILALLLGVKSIYGDVYIPEGQREIRVLEAAKGYLLSHYSGALYDWHVVTVKVVSIDLAAEEAYVRGRRYLFWVLPIGDVFFDVPYEGDA